MSYWKTPREVALEQKIEELKYELDCYKSIHPLPSCNILEEPPLKEVSFSQTHLSLAALVSVKHKDFAYHVIGRWLGPDGPEFRYYLSDVTILGPGDKAAILSHLHGRVIEQLAKDMA